MANGKDDIVDIFENHINEIDERQTPRWEMSEDEQEEIKAQTKSLDCQHEHPKPVKQVGNSKIHVSKGSVWDGYEDSVKDYTTAFREQEKKYMERTNEAIFNRASQNHIHQPSPYDDTDSVKNYGDTTQDVSRIPSNEKLCLSPLLPQGYEVNDGLIDEKRGKSQTNTFISDDVIDATKIKVDARIGTNMWHGVVDMDITRDYAKEGSLENSSRPSSEDISLTPPWLDTDKESSCKDANEQVIDDSELLSGNATTTSNPAHDAIPTTTHATSVNIDKTHMVGSSTLNDPKARPSHEAARILGKSSNAVSHSVGSTLESIPVPRHPTMNPVGSTLESIPVPRHPTMNPILSHEAAQVRQLSGDVFPNRYPPPHQSYSGKDPYFTTLPYPNVPHYPQGEIRFPPPPTASEYMQQPNINGFSRMSPFINQPYLPQPQPIHNDTSFNPTCKSFPNIPPVNAGYYTNVHDPRQVLNMSQVSFYGSQPGNWQQYQGRTQVPSKVTPKVNCDDFATDELIDYGAQSDISERVRPPMDNMHRNIPPRDSVPQIYRNKPDLLQNNKNIHRDVSEFHRDVADTKNQRKIPTHQLPLPDIHTRYTDVLDNITTVSDSDVSPVMSTRSGSQSSLAVYCTTPHHDGLETSSVMSFTSGASTHQDLDSKIDQVRNLLAVIDTRDAKETVQTLLSVSNSKENCQAMRLSGCLHLLIQLQHKCKTRDPRVAHDVRVRSLQAIRNIVSAGMDDKRGKREIRVLQLLEIVRNYCIEVRYIRQAPNSSKISSLSNALAAIMKLSFEEDHRTAISDLGGVEAIGEFLELSHVTQDLLLSNNLRKYASMTLTNMTFEKTRSKALLGNSSGIVRALLKNLAVFDDEDLIQVSASVLRNLSCKSDERSKAVLQECNAVSELMTAAQKVSSESTLRTILYAVWNLSAHSTENKVELCENANNLGFLVGMLVYKSPSNTLSVVESSGGILRNLSSQIAVKTEYRDIMRGHDCYKFLLVNLRSPSLRVVANACGILWNLSARCETDQQLLLKMNALSLLKPLVASKNKSISKGASAAIKNLQNYKNSQPGRFSPPEPRKQNGILRQDSSSPLTSRQKGKSRDAHSLNSFTGSADDMSRETGKQRSKENVEADSVKTKGVRWSDEKRLSRKSIGDRKRSDSSPEEQNVKEQETRNGLVKDLADGIKNIDIGDKSRCKKMEGDNSSSRTKKKSNIKNKKYYSGGDDIDENFADLHFTRSSSSRQNSGSNRRLTSVDVHTTEVPSKQSTKLTRSKDVRKGTSGGRVEDHEQIRSVDENCRKSPMSNGRSSRHYSEETDREGVTEKKKEPLSQQRCQCPDELDVWVKREKICGHCEKRRISHSSDSTSGSRRSSSESLSSSSRYLNRKEQLSNVAGYVTTI